MNMAQKSYKALMLRHKSRDIVLFCCPEYGVKLFKFMKAR